MRSSLTLRAPPPPHPTPPALQPEAVRAATEAIVSQPPERLGEALAGFTWSFDTKVGLVLCGNAIRCSQGEDRE